MRAEQQEETDIASSCAAGTLTRRNPRAEIGQVRMSETILTAPMPNLGITPLIVSSE